MFFNILMFSMMQYYNTREAQFLKINQNIKDIKLCVYSSKPDSKKIDEVRTLLMQLEDEVKKLSEI